MSNTEQDEQHLEDDLQNKLRKIKKSILSKSTNWVVYTNWNKNKSNALQSTTTIISE